MIFILGLIILIAAVVVAVAGVLGNSGSGHGMGQGFEVFGYHVTGSTGILFLYGIVVGAVLLFGLGVMLAGAHRAFKRGRAARAELRESRRQRAAHDDRDYVTGPQETARTDAATGPQGMTGPQDGRPPAEPPPASASAGRGAPHRRRHLFGH